jgi:hypothetical protein
MFQETSLNFSGLPQRRGQSTGSEFAGSGASLSTVEGRLAVVENDVADLEASKTSRAKLRFVS